MKKCKRIGRFCLGTRHEYFFLNLICFILVYQVEVSGEVYKDTCNIMGTKWDITIVGVNRLKAKKTSEQVFEEIKSVDRIMSLYKKESELCKINEKARSSNWNEEIKISSEISDVLKIAFKVSALSNGAFDVSIGPLVKLWGFAGEYPDDTRKVPSNNELENAKSLVNYKNIIFNPEKKTIKFLKKGMMLDFGGIAKGYAIDRAIKIFKINNITNAMLNAGGQVRAIGNNPEGKLWKVGVRHPRDKEKFITVLKCIDKSISTSGDYEHYFQRNDKMYHHIIDPEKGISTYNSISVTVVLNSDDKESESTFADALSTAVFVLGGTEGMKLIKSVKGCEGIIVTEIQEVALQPAKLRLPAQIKVIVSNGLKDLEFNY